MCTAAEITMIQGPNNFFLIVTLNQNKKYQITVIVSLNNIMQIL